MIVVRSFYYVKFGYVSAKKQKKKTIAAREFKMAVACVRPKFKKRTALTIGLQCFAMYTKILHF